MDAIAHTISNVPPALISFTLLTFYSSRPRDQRRNCGNDYQGFIGSWHDMFHLPASAVESAGVWWHAAQWHWGTET